MQVMCPRCRKRMAIEEKAIEADCRCGYHFDAQELTLIRHLEEELSFDTPPQGSSQGEKVVSSSAVRQRKTNEAADQSPFWNEEGEPEKKEEEFLSTPKTGEDFSDIREFAQSASKRTDLQTPPHALLLTHILDFEKEKILSALQEVFADMDLRDFERQLSAGKVYMTAVNEVEAIRLADRLKDLHCEIEFGLPQQIEGLSKETLQKGREKKKKDEGEFLSQRAKKPSVSIDERKEVRVSVPAEKRTSSLIRSKELKERGRLPEELIITTADAVSGYEIVAHCGILSAQETLKEEVLLENLSAGVGILEHSEYVSAISRLEKTLRDKALAKGANAVIAVSFTTTLIPAELEGPALMILATGTAVKLKSWD